MSSEKSSRTSTTWWSVHAIRIHFVCKAKVWLVKHVALLKFTTIVNNCTSANVSTMFDWRIFIHGSLAQNAPFFNVTSTKNFQTEKNKGSRWPIFEIKTVFLGERLICHLPCVDLSWVIRVFRKSLLKMTFTLKNDRIWSIFKCKRIELLLRKNRSF